MPTRMAKCAALAAVTAILVSFPAQAKTFRWAFQGDVAMMDPYGLLETMTIGFLSNIYEPLIYRSPDLSLKPALATEWELVEPALWRFELREGVQFHDGSPFTAADVVFSMERARAEGSDFVSYLATVDRVVAVDDFTVEFHTFQPDPVLPDRLTVISVMSREWAEEHDAVQPTDIRAGTENYAARHASGTGPFVLVSREADVRTVLAPNPDWWGEATHNVTEAIFTPIGSDPTRVAALLSGELDFAYPVPIQDFRRIEAAPDLELLRGPELRTIFLGMDQARDELLESSVAGANPLKDRRVRLAMAKAIDVEAIHRIVMRGASTPTGLMVAPGIRGFEPALNDRWAVDIEGAQALLAEAGYPDGFTLGMDCPNDRYVNDEAICQAVAAGLARIGIDIDLLAQTKSKYFAKVLSYDTSFYLLGWTPGTYDAHDALFNLAMTRGERGQGKFNLGGYSNPLLDAAAKAAGIELDPQKRHELLSEAFTILKDDVGYIPLHQQMLAWGVKGNVSLRQRSDNIFELRWVQVD